MDSVLQGLDFLFVYLDDILVASKDRDEHKQHLLTLSLYAEQILNKIANTFDGTYAGLKSMLQRFRKYFFWNPALKGVESTS